MNNSGWPRSTIHEIQGYPNEASTRGAMCRAPVNCVPSKVNPLECTLPPGKLLNAEECEANR